MFLFLLAATAALGQAANGSISGTVLDPQHQAIPGATVVVTNTGLGSKRTLTTDASGRFAAAQLLPGGYSLTASARGFKSPHAQAVTLGLGSSVTVQLTLALATAEQQVNVSAAGVIVEGQTTAPAVDKDSPQVSNAIAGLTVTYLPNRDRDFTQFGSLSAGAEATSSGLVIDGQPAASTEVAVDGVNFDDPLNGGVRGGGDGGFFLPQTMVQDFSLSHAGADAAEGDSDGGFVNVSTKEGSNRWHGEQFYIIRPGGWTGTDAFGHAMNDTQNEFGGSIGGDLIQNRVYFYGGGEQDFVHEPYYSEFQPQAPGVAVPANLATQQGETVGHNDPTALALRLDVNLSQTTTLSLLGVYNRVDYSNLNPGSSQVWSAASAGESLYGQSDTIFATLTTAMGPRVNELTAQWAGDRRDYRPNSAEPAQIINGFGELGGDATGEHWFTSLQRGAHDDLAWSLPGQMLHFGGGFAHDPALMQQQPNLDGAYDYTSLAAYLADTPRRFQQEAAATPGSLAYQGAVERGDVYANDRVAVTDNVSLTGGLRWDGQWNPQPAGGAIPNDLAQWQPRLGLAWNPRSKTNAATTVRLSAGLYDAPTPANLFAPVFIDNGVNAVVSDSLYAPGVTPLVETIAPDFRNARSFQTAASVQQELGKRADVTTGYTHNATSDLPQILNTNLSAPAYDAADMPIFPAARPLPGYGQILRDGSNARSIYDGWTTTADFRLAYSTTLTANYTLARTRDDGPASGPFAISPVLNPFNVAAEWADSDQDVRNNFNISGTDRLPLGFKINPMFVARSGLPYTPVIGFDTQNDGNDFNDRATLDGAVAARNSLRQPAMYDLDLRFVKDFTLKGRGHHLDLFLDVFNVTNHGNKNFGPLGLGYYGDAANPVYAAGLPLFAASTTDLGGPRQIQFTARLVGF